MKENIHPKQPYTHNLSKVCNVEGCNYLGEMQNCHICGQKKRKTRCKFHRDKEKEMRKILRGDLKNILK